MVQKQGSQRKTAVESNQHKFQIRHEDTNRLESLVRKNQIKWGQIHKMNYKEFLKELLLEPLLEDRVEPGSARG